MNLKASHTIITALLVFAPVCMAWADDLPPTPPPFHSDQPATRIETILNETGVPVSTTRVEFGSFGGKESDVVNGAFYNPDDSRIFVNGIVLKTPGSPGVMAAGLEIEISETISNRETSSTLASARYVDPSDIPTLQKFVDTMANVAQETPVAGENAEVTFETPGGTVLYYRQNGTHTPDFAAVNGPQDYYAFQFNKLSDVLKFKSALDRAAAWVAQQ